MKEYKGFKVGNRVKVRILDRDEMNKSKVAPEFIVRFGGMIGNIENISEEGYIRVSNKELSCRIASPHVEVLLEHVCVIPEHLFEI